MKKIAVLLAVIIGLVLSMPVMAEDQKTAAVTQFMVATDHNFWKNDSSHFSGYAYATFFYNLNQDYAAVYGYSGTKISFGKENIYLLGVMFADAYSWSPGPSLWLEFTGKKNYMFAEFDYYVPWLSTSHEDDAILPPHQYYGTAECSRSLKDNISLGIMFETFGAFNEVNPGELAYGPTFTFKKIKVWAFYDSTPLINNEDYVGLRIKFTF